MIRYCWRCAAVLPAAGRQRAGGSPARTACPETICARCGEVHYRNPKPCGCAVALDGGRVLLLLRARDPDARTWTIPGGFCEAAEHPMQAAERELHEEVGLRGRATAYLGTWMDTYGEPDADGLAVHTAVSGYLVALDDPAATPQPAPEEAIDARWFALDALPEALAFPAHVPAMIDAAALLARPGAAVSPMLDRTW